MPLPMATRVRTAAPASASASATTTAVTTAVSARAASGRRGAIAAITVVGAGAAGDGESSRDSLRRTQVDVVLREVHPRASDVEGRQRHCVAQDSADGVEAAIQTVEELHRQVRIGHRSAGIGKAIREGLQAAGVVGDPEVPLLEVVVLACQVEVAGSLVGEEVILDARPCMR